MGLELAFQVNKHVLSASHEPGAMPVNRVSKGNVLETYI